MTRERRISTSFVWLLLAILVGGLAFEPMALAAIGDKAAKPAAKRAAAKLRGRLPSHYGKIVSGEQREKIYKIQKNYAAELTELTKKLADLRARRKEEIEAVLTSEQLSKVRELAAAAKSKRDKSKAKASAK